MSLFCILLASLAGCASGPNGSTSNNAAVNTSPLPSASPGVSPSPGSTPSLIQFALSINDQGTFDAVNGFYVIMLNAFDQPIDVSNNETFTDYMLYDGSNLTWYHRQTQAQNNLFTFIATNLLNTNLSFSEDRLTMYVTFSLSDQTNALNTFITTSQFTATAATTDRNGILGRILDTMGPGPSLSNDTLYTLYIDKALGVTRPVPPNYPTDPLDDWVTQPDLGDNFPYVNFDIKQFTVSVH